ncbi:hypothetical protein ACFQ07_13215, partial [Actinomadura adrarensis]
GRTALLRAIDLGAYDIAEALISEGATSHLKDSAGRAALALARHWHETGTAAELRRRTGLNGPITRRTVHLECGTCVELSLGDLTVRDGHTAILTALEPKYGINPPFEELLSRAMTEPDIDHIVWWETAYTLQKRRDPAVWQAAAALRDRQDPLERYFGAELLRLIHLFDESDNAPFDGQLVDLFLPWVARETDPRVTAVLARGLGETADPRAREPLPELTRHRDG